MSFCFRIGRSTVCSIVEETCQAIYDVLMKEYVTPPSCAAEWEEISKEFNLRWNFPHCLGKVSVFFNQTFINIILLIPCRCY